MSAAPAPAVQPVHPVQPVQPVTPSPPVNELVQADHDSFYRAVFQAAHARGYLSDIITAFNNIDKSDMYKSLNAPGGRFAYCLGDQEDIFCQFVRECVKKLIVGDYRLDSQEAQVNKVFDTFVNRFRGFLKDNPVITLEDAGKQFLLSDCLLGFFKQTTSSLTFLEYTRKCNPYQTVLLGDGVDGLTLYLVQEFVHDLAKIDLVCPFVGDPARIIAWPPLEIADRNLHLTRDSRTGMFTWFRYEKFTAERSAAQQVETAQSKLEELTPNEIIYDAAFRKLYNETQLWLRERGSTSQNIRGGSAENRKHGTSKRHIKKIPRSSKRERGIE